MIQEVNIEYTFLQETVFLNTQGYVHLYIYFLVFRLYLCYIKILRCEFRVRLFRMQWFSIFTHSHTCIIILNGWKLRQNPQLVYIFSKTKYWGLIYRYFKAVYICCDRFIINLKKSIWEKKNVSLSKLIELFMDAKLAHVKMRVEYHVYIFI